jgi:hypothetical protein
MSQFEKLQQELGRANYLLHLWAIQPFQVSFTLSSIKSQPLHLGTFDTVFRNIQYIILLEQG